MEHFTDDQIALIGCAVAFVVSGMLLTITHQFSRRNEPQTLEMPKPDTRRRRLASRRRKAA